MRREIKYLVTLIYKPLLARYLASTRRYRYKGISLVIPPEVFHPGFFFSTKILLRYISRLPLGQLSLLELGAGNGLISLYAASKGSMVTASDINPVAIEYLKLNQVRNGVELTILHSDLFKDIPSREFDVIAVNPPYYKKTPKSNIDHAWYCGENGEYFNGFFHGLAPYRHSGSRVLMILSEGCDMGMICRHAGKYGWVLKEILTEKNFIERLSIYEIDPV